MGRNQAEDAVRRERQATRAELEGTRQAIEARVAAHDQELRLLSRQVSQAGRTGVHDPALFRQAETRIAWLKGEIGKGRKAIAEIDAAIRELFRDLPRFATGTETATPRLSKADVLALVASAAVSLRGVQKQNAKNLYERMVSPDFEYTYGKHRGGNRENPDWNWHVTVRVNGQGYHLEVDRRNAIWKITPSVPPLGGGAAPSGPAPHERPGAH